MKDQPKEEKAGALVPVDQGLDTSAVEYLQQVKALLARKKQKEAFLLIQQAHVRYPKDPYVLSYYGWLQAVVDRRYRSGVEMCAAAVELLKKHALKGSEVHYGLVYQNLARAYLAAGKKKDAIDTLQKGLKHDAGNKELHKELTAMGRRKKQPVPFLDRSHPLNKYLGLIRDKIK